jgi:hypothetical protein
MRSFLRLGAVAAALLISLSAPSVANAAPVGAMAGAHHTSVVTPNDHACCSIKWVITSVGGAYRTQGGWFDCAPLVDNDGYNATWGCTNSYAVGNTVNGSVNVSDGTISAAVGFSVTQTWTSGQTYSLAPGSDWYGVFQSASVYSTKDVHQAQQECYLTPPITCWNTGSTAVAHASHWLGWTYRPVQMADD